MDRWACIIIVCAVAAGILMLEILFGLILRERQLRRRIAANKTALTEGVRRAERDTRGGGPPAEGCSGAASDGRAAVDACSACAACIAKTGRTSCNKTFG